MMVVKVEMWPNGDPSKAEVIGTATFTCLGEAASGERGYEVRLLKDAQFSSVKGEAYAGPARILAASGREVWKAGFVRGHFPGKRGIWDLVGGACSAILGARTADYRCFEPKNKR